MASLRETVGKTTGNPKSKASRLVSGCFWVGQGASGWQGCNPGWEGYIGVQVREGMQVCRVDPEGH